MLSARLRAMAKDDAALGPKTREIPTSSLKGAKLVSFISSLWSAIAASHRAHASLSVFGAGSEAPPRVIVDVAAVVIL